MTNMVLARSNRTSSSETRHQRTQSSSIVNNGTHTINIQWLTQLIIQLIMLFKCVRVYQYIKHQYFQYWPHVNILQHKTDKHTLQVPLVYKYTHITRDFLGHVTLVPTGLVKESDFHASGQGILVKPTLDFSDYQTLPSPLTRHKLCKCEEYQVSTVVQSPC